MMKLFRNNTTTKLISLLSAMFLWFVVMDNANPVITVDLNVPLKIEHESTLLDKGLAIKNKNFPKNVSISLKGRRDKMSLVNAIDIEALLDLSKVQDVNSKVLYVEVYMNKEGISFEGVTPRAINIEIEKIGQNRFPVEVVTSGKLKPGYKIIGMTTAPSVLTIQDKDSIINSIGKIKALVDVSNLDRDILVQKTCRVYNKSGVEITDLHKELKVDVKIEVAKEVSIVPVVKGKPSPNYIDGIRNVSLKTALIIGEPNILEKIDEIRTDQIDIENAKENISKVVALIIPAGVKLVDTPENISVNVVIEQLARKQFLFVKEDIALLNIDKKPELKYELKDQGITVEVEGNSAELEKLDKQSLKPSIDVLGLNEGQHKVNLNLTLPGTVRVSKKYEMEIQIGKR